jgi:hypothetical protein
MNMPLPKQILSVIFVGILLQAGLPAQASVPDETTTITLDQPVHFLGIDGSDVVADPGEYTVEAAQEWLRLIPGTERRDALLVEAQPGTHEVKVEIPIVLSTPGSEPDELDVHVVQLLNPDGMSMVATGTYSGIQSRGLFDFAKQAAARARAAAEAARRAAAAKAQQAAQAALKAKQAAEQAAKAAAQKAQELALKAKQEAERVAKEAAAKAGQVAKIVACKATVGAMKAGKAAATFMQKIVPIAQNNQKSMKDKLTKDLAFRENVSQKIAQGVHANQYVIPELKRIQAWMENPANKAKLEAIFSTGNFCEDSIATMEAKIKQLGIAPNFALIQSRGGETPHFYMGYQITFDAGLGLGVLGGLYGVTDFKGNGGKYWFLGAQGGIIAGGGGAAQVTFFPKVDLASFDGPGWGVGGSLGTVGTFNADVTFDEKFQKFQGFGVGGGAGVGPAKMFGDIAVSWDWSWKY